MPQDIKQILADSVVKALAYKENGGMPDLQNPVAGPTGEMKSIFQFLPATWKGYAKDILGDENAPLTLENEMKVVHGKVSNWLDEGKTVGQIASIWNSGSPDKYKQNWRGTNNGVPYDTPKYAEDVINYSKKFFEEKTKASQRTPSTLPNLARNSTTQQSTTPRYTPPTIYQAPKDAEWKIKPVI